jgi:general secretion pathway protein I
MKALRGFTLLEVLVAVAILGFGLVAILSAQYGAVRGVSHARYVNQAVGLARCRMSEIEEQLARDGFPELDDNGTGPCCADEDVAGMSCEWRIERPTFPDPDLGKLDLDTDLGALGKLATGSEGDAQLPDAEAGISGVTQALQGDGQLGDLAAGGIGGVASIVMGIVYPDLKAMFEASTRRVTVSVVWTEGSRNYDITAVQWVTKPEAGAVSPDLLGGLEEPTDESSTGSSSGSGTGPKTKKSSGGAR